MSGQLGGTLLRLTRRVSWPALCAAAVLAAPAPALGVSGSPLRPDPSPTVPDVAGPAPDAPSANPAAPATTTASRAAPVRRTAPSAPARVVQARSGVASEPVVRRTPAPAAGVTTRTGPVQKKQVQKKHSSRAQAAHRAPPRSTPLRLGVRYALAPPIAALSRDRFLLPAALALLVLLLASGSFLGLVYRLRQELARS